MVDEQKELKRKALSVVQRFTCKSRFVAFRTWVGRVCEIERQKCLIFKAVKRLSHGTKSAAFERWNQSIAIQTAMFNCILSRMLSTGWRGWSKREKETIDGCAEMQRDEMIKRITFVQSESYKRRRASIIFRSWCQIQVHARYECLQRSVCWHLWSSYTRARNLAVERKLNEALRTPAACVQRFTMRSMVFHHWRLRTLRELRRDLISRVSVLVQTMANLTAENIMHFAASSSMNSTPQKPVLVTPEKMATVGKCCDQKQVAQNPLSRTFLESMSEAKPTLVSPRHHYV